MVERSGGTARPVAGRKTFILNNNKDLLLVAGFTHERKTRQASLFIKNIPYRYSSYGMKNMSKEITNSKFDKGPQAYRLKKR